MTFGDYSAFLISSNWLVDIPGISSFYLINLIRSFPCVFKTNNETKKPFYLKEVVPISY